MGINVRNSYDPCRTRPPNWRILNAENTHRMIAVERQHNLHGSAIIFVLKIFLLHVHCRFKAPNPPSGTVQLETVMQALAFLLSPLLCICRVATNLKNLEYSGISLNMEKLREFCATSGKIVTSKVFLVRHSNIYVKQLLTG